MVNEPLKALLSPTSIAVVGASPDAQYAAGLIDNLLDFGYDGELFLVNPSRETAWNRPCYDDISDIPAVVDLAVISVPRQYVPGVVRDAAEMGISAALIITAGFGEADEKGLELQTELEAIVNESAIRVCGPNCLGIANTHAEIVLANTCTRKPGKGSIGLVSQSGALAFTTFFEQGADSDVNFSYIVSTGNEADLTTTDYIEYMIDDPTVDVICTYIEGVADPARFMAAVERATREGIPVLTTKIGRSDVVNQATISHTGSVTGNDDAWDAAFAQTGVERVSSIGGLLTKSQAHVLSPTPDIESVCIVSTSGGLGSLLADLAVENGLSVPQMNSRSEQFLLELESLLTFGHVQNPLDIRGYGLTVLEEVGEILMADDSFDAYVFGLGVPAVGEIAEAIVSDILTFAEHASDPVFIVWTGRRTPYDELGQIQPYEHLRKSIPVYYDAEQAISALASLHTFSNSRNRVSTKPSRNTLQSAHKFEESEQTASGVLSWTEAESLLERYNIPVLETYLATSPTEAIEYSESFNSPVVLKVDSPDIPHRAAVDAVKTNLSSADEISDAFTAIHDNCSTHVPTAEINGILVQPQCTDSIEVLVGISSDETFGHVLTVAPGGSLVEVIDDVSIRIPPVANQDAVDLIQSTAVQSLIDASSDPSANRQALATLIEQVGNLAHTETSLRELDLNPVLVADGNAVAIDTLLRME